MLNEIKRLIRQGKAVKDNGNTSQDISNQSTDSDVDEQLSQATKSMHLQPDGVGLPIALSQPLQEHLGPFGSGTPSANEVNRQLGYAPPAAATIADKAQPAQTVQTDASARGSPAPASNQASKAAQQAASAASSNKQQDAAQYNKEAQQIVTEERQAAEKMPKYEGLTDKFDLICKMGDGAFSNVYKARDRRTGKKVAIKVVRKYELNSNQRANILKEVQIMRGLKHGGVVELLDFSEARDHYYLVLELMEGGELFHQIVKLTYFSEPLARHVILQVAHAIRYLHEERGVVHRDIKPENLLFESIKIIPSKVAKARPYDEEKEDEGEFMPGIGGGGIGRVKLADFGLSKVVWEESTMTPCGTVGYTAPEIVKDERYSKSVDMWALGCVLYTLLCGFPPFYDESISVLTEKVARGYYTFLSPWWDDISNSAKDLITHLLCVDPRQRYTIDQFLAHPWCNVKDPRPDLNSADIALAKASEMPLDSPLLQSMKGSSVKVQPGIRNGMMSPGVHQLKEAFDVTYAVHRMEEEGNRRRAEGYATNGERLADLNEDDSDEEIAEEVQHATQKYGSQAGAAIGRHAAGQQQQQLAAQQARQQQQYQGRGGADPKIAEAVLYDGRAGPRDRGNAAHRKRGFELNMGNATLLGRRNRGGMDANLNLQNFGGLGASPVAVTTHRAPRSD
ncbi:MAPK-activated protein kinase Srk1 [Tilletia horrida]|uniref:MAPK-activated protein kinase Srk1 n=1 Tax=Tilletia horrida TaxID=155126 RepID=A0AAN6JSB2_9BASI|nr:MAPK-activated protein kinase Srk1 [Tilletia horrida]KAK0568031.1 MAPK-activated protein kinase Srk1 [Tilletia horrida]